MLIVVILIGRLFYLQIIRHDHYRAAALRDQLKEYSIAADRGVIYAHEAGSVVPVVLNEKLYTLYADPIYVKDADTAAAKLAAITKGEAAKYQKALQAKNSRYQVLERRLGEGLKNQITALKLPGIGTQAQSYRTYPQGTLAAQLLGFVNNDGQGKYGVEQSLDEDLAGIPGRLKAITDAEGVPLAASRDNIQISPKAGQDVVLTIDVAMQKQLEDALKRGLERVRSDSGSAVILDPDSGAIKAMANLPTYYPAEFYKVTDQKIFNNAAVSDPLEVGSVMKVLTMAAALDQGVVKPDTTYYDPSRWELDDHTITNIEEVGGPGERNMAAILDKSINTGATWVLMQMGGQTGKVTKQARERWHDYMVDHYQFGKLTGVEQGYESGGTVPDPNDGFALQLTYANTSFGQSMTATPLQLAAALSSVINGGTYYRPYLVDSSTGSDGRKVSTKPKAIRQGVVASRVSPQIRGMMEYVVSTHSIRPKFPDSYSVGGKTGTAQIANPAGGYYGDRFNGTYIGFVGGDRPEYVIAVRVNEPKIGKYAGSAAAQPIFGELAHMLINNFNVPPKTR
jgi:cell division protein FtsI/penicillin-binding protein 2